MRGAVPSGKDSRRQRRTEWVATRGGERQDKRRTLLKLRCRCVLPSHLHSRRRCLRMSGDPWRAARQRGCQRQCGWCFVCPKRIINEDITMEQWQY